MTNKITISIKGTKVNEIVKSLNSLYPECNWKYKDGEIDGYENYEENYIPSRIDRFGNSIPPEYYTNKKIYANELSGRINRYKSKHGYNDEELLLENVKEENVDD